MKILGISCFYHDSAAALIINGEVVAAALEERFTRLKHDSSFPTQAIDFCLSFSKLNINEIDAIIFYEKPIRKFSRIVEDLIYYWPSPWRIFPRLINEWLGYKLNFSAVVKKKLNYKGPVYFSDHHISHAASSYYLSPFDDCAYLVMDGVGERASISYGVCEKNKIKPLKEVHFPVSLGILYSVFTAYLGFEVNEGEYKVMGLAPYGKAKYKNIILTKMIKLLPDGLFELNSDYFSFYSDEIGYVEKKFISELGVAPRKLKTDPILPEHQDLAKSIQEVYEELAIRILEHVAQTTRKNKIVLSGGTALNCVANTRFRDSKIFDDMFIFNSPGDAGAAIGAALWLYYDHENNNFNPKKIEHNFWGPSFDEQEIKDYLDEKKIAYQKLNLDTIVDAICGQKVVGWFQERMEFGPRALGNRSILADATNKENWKRVNLKIKFRESFRPFAPVVLEGFSELHFKMNYSSPFMMYVAEVKNETTPATTHVDNSARVQTVSANNNKQLTDLLEKYYKRSSIPILINTSMNLNNDPVACSPKDALNVFEKSEMDILVLGNWVISK